MSTGTDQGGPCLPAKAAFAFWLRGFLSDLHGKGSFRPWALNLGVQRRCGGAVKQGTTCHVRWKVV